MTEHLPLPDTTRFPDLDDQYVRTLDTTVTIGRIYFTGGSYPGTWDQFRSFGPTDSRFDHHRIPAAVHDDRAIMYLAPALPDARGRTTSALETALVECFRDTGTVDARTNLPYFVTFTPTRPLRLLDLADSDWITTAGGNAAISSGPRKTARRWSKAIYEHYPANDIDGLIYISSNKPANRAIALYERAADALPNRPTFNEPLDHVGLQPAIEQFAYRVGLSLIA